MSETKVCNACNKEKPVEDFNKRGGFYKDGSPKLAGKCRDCQNEYHRRYWADHPEFKNKVSENHKQWVEANKEKRNEYQRNYNKRHPGRTNEANKKWRDANPDKVKLSIKKWAQANKDKLREYHREYRKLHPERRNEWKEKNVNVLSAYWRIYNTDRKHADPEYAETRLEYRRVRNLRKRGVGGSHTIIEWEALKAQHNYTCLCCGWREPEVKLTRDHIVAITKGGTDDISNIQPLCGPCNSKKQTELIDFRESR